MIRNVEISDMAEIARLHMESFESHFLPKLGVKLLTKYYEAFFDNKNIFLVNINDKNRIDGLVLGTPDSSVGRNNFIKNNKLRLSLRILLLCLLLEKDTWVRVKGRFLPSKINDNNVISSQDISNLKTISLLSICVSQHSKGKGVSKALVDTFEDRLPKLGYDAYRLSVHKDNDRANNFYKKIGMSIYKESGTEYSYVKQTVNK
jgi:ribosomal protein S18 acetylase RimI-like enzyme